MTFTPINYQLTLFDFNAMRPTTRIPIKRISRARMEQAMVEFRRGKEKGLVNILRDVNDALERYDQRLTNRK